MLEEEIVASLWLIIIRIFKNHHRLIFDRKKLFLLVYTRGMEGNSFDSISLRGGHFSTKILLYKH
jgi:hypothetical protein